MKRSTAIAVGIACLSAAFVAFAGCGSGGDPDPSSAQAPARLDHVAVVVLENKELGQVIGSKQAPWLTAQASRGAVATDYYALTHPSLPNYLALLGGSTFGIRDDCTDCHVDATNLVDQLESGGLSWRAYMESAPSACFRPKSPQDEHGLYAKRHNPFFYFDDLRSSAERCANVVPYTQLAKDARSADGLPDFLWISPNLCNDTHDCAVGRGDRWLAKNMPPLLNAMGENSALFITWDEGTTNAGCCDGADGGRVPLVALGSAARAHGVEPRPRDHYALLRTIEDALHLPSLRRAATSPSVDELLGKVG
jgi:hypothetical protein